MHVEVLQTYAPKRSNSDAFGCIEIQGDNRQLCSTFRQRESPLKSMTFDCVLKFIIDVVNGFAATYSSYYHIDALYVSH